MSENKAWTNITDKETIASFLLIASSVAETYNSDHDLITSADVPAHKVNAQYISDQVTLNDFSLYLENGNNIDVNIANASNSSEWQSSLLSLIDSA